MFFGALGACSGATYGNDGHSMRPLERVRAARVIREALSGHGLVPQEGHRVRITGRREVDCDVGVSGTRNCVEYMNEADRALLGSAIPGHSSPDALVLVASAEGDAGGHVLVIDDQDFLYEPDPHRTGPGRPGVGEVEDRMRRVVIDYASWLREHAGR